MYKRKVCICNTVPEESFKSPRSMSFCHAQVSSGCLSKMKPLETHDRQEVQELTSLISLPLLIFLPIHKTTAPVAVCPLQTHLLSGTVFVLAALSRIAPLCAHAGEWGGVCLERDTLLNNILFYHKYTVSLCDWNQLHNVQCKYSSTGWKSLLFFILLYIISHLLPDNQRLSSFPRQGVKTCHLSPSMSCVCLDGCFQQRQHNIAAPPTNHLSRPNQYTSAEIIYAIEQCVNLRWCQFIAGFICCHFSLPLLLR